MSVPKELCHHTSDQVGVYDQISPSLAVSSGIRQECPLSLFLSSFIIKDALDNGLSGLLDGGVAFLPRNTILGSEYTDEVALLSGDAQTIQSASERLTIVVSRYGMCFAP